nr:hypothetical protein [Tanacetum cinerariifolium]
RAPPRRGRVGGRGPTAAGSGGPAAARNQKPAFGRARRARLTAPHRGPGPGRKRRGARGRAAQHLPQPPRSTAGAAR